MPAIQSILVITLVLTAGAYLARKAWNSLAGKAGGSCGCADCPAKSSQPSPTAPPTTLFNPLNNITRTESTSHKPRIRLLG